MTLDVVRGPGFSTIATITAGVLWGIFRVWDKIGDHRREKLMKSVKLTGEKTHALSNGAMAFQKKLNIEFAERIAVQAHRLAGLTGDAGDVAAAVAAEVVVEQQREVYREHIARQKAEAEIDPVEPQKS